ncbi:MAG: DGQHR domain-containing protein [Phycisphaeraceae bacterium]|nr:DGQHR domain-containing protein [Phycisphaeraceae bacterium]
MGKKKASTGHLTKKVSSRSRRAAANQPHVEFDCLPLVQGEHTLLVFPASAKTLWSLVQINQREEDKEEGYQRTLSPARANKIAKFIEAGNLLPTCILVTFDKAKLANDNRTLIVDNEPDAGWVIDGQHRLEGAHRASTDIMVPVVAFVDLPLEQQVHCFVTINKEQKGVSASLYIDLLKHLPPTKSESDLMKERAADLGSSLKLDDQSPFYSKIVVTTAPAAGEISMVNFVRKVTPLIRRDGRLNAFNDEDKKAVLENYYRGLSHVFPAEYRKNNSVFFKTIGFGALMTALPTFLDMTINERKAFTVEDVISTFKRIAHFDFSAWHERGTGTHAENMAAEDLRAELLDAIDTQSGPVKLR